MIPGTFMMEWLTSSLLPRQRETKCLRKEGYRGRLRQSEVFFPLADHGTVVDHVMFFQAFILVLLS